MLEINLDLTGALMESPHTTLPNNLASSSQVSTNVNSTLLEPVSTTTSEIEEALEMIRETKIEIFILKQIKVMLFNKEFAKKFILI